MLDLDNFGNSHSESMENDTLSHVKSSLSLRQNNQFKARHLGINEPSAKIMLDALGYDSLDQLIDQAVPPSIRLNQSLKLPSASSESQALAQLKEIAQENEVFTNYIGMGYSNCITPPVIQRNILENPNWYTAYTPYQPEIAQGRLEALLNYQTMIIDLTGLEIANASLLDEGTAAAEAMTMSYGVCKNKSNRFFCRSHLSSPNHCGN